MKIEINDEITMDAAELYARVRKANGLRGRQVVNDHARELDDGWVFYSNARGGYGELLSFHYENTADLLRDITGKEAADA